MTFTATTTPDGRVHIEFERTDSVNTLKDAIVVGSAQYATWTEAFVDGLIEQRWLNYLEAITPPPLPEPPEGFEFVRDEFDMVVLDENGEPVLVAIVVEGEE